MRSGMISSAIRCARDQGPTVFVYGFRSPFNADPIAADVNFNRQANRHEKRFDAIILALAALSYRFYNPRSFSFRMKFRNGARNGARAIVFHGDVRNVA